MIDLRASIRRILRGPVPSRLLERCGIEPRRYWLLVDLFQTLSKRHEDARMGSHDYSPVAAVWFIMGSLISPFMAVMGARSGAYLLLFCGLSVFHLSILLIPEVAESLVNPVAHQPVNGATWPGAKLTSCDRNRCPCRGEGEWCIGARRCVSSAPEPSRTDEGVDSQARLTLDF